ncbi:MAG: glycosyltransferase family 2 protein [Paludibacteraceae bacterium]|nr:glycosyltransferase family 2 protein [Paludibacteraceae bacterium]
MDSQIQVSILMVNYGTAALMQAAVDSVVRQVPQQVGYEFVLVDNASQPDEVRQIPAQFPGQQIQVLCLDQNVGFGGANNAGYALCHGAYIFFLNPDTLLRNDAVGILCSYLGQHPEVGACGGNLFDAQGLPAHSHMLLPPSLKLEWSILFGDRWVEWWCGRSFSHNYTGQPLEVAYITGADLLVRRSVLEQVGLFDPAFFMYYEETDLCKRIHDAGYRVMNVPQSEIVHLEGASFSQQARREHLKAQSRRLYYRKHLSRCEALACYAVLTLSACLHWCWHLLSGHRLQRAYWETVLREM